MKYLPPTVFLYLYKSTIQPCMGYCCHAWVGVPSCYCHVGLLILHLMPLLNLWHGRNVASLLNLYYRCYFGRYSSELAQLVPLPFSQGKCARYSDRFHDFSVTIPICRKDVYVKSFFPRIARLWNSLLVEYFPLTYDLNGLELTDIF